MATDNSRKSPAWHAREAANAERFRQLRDPGPAIDPAGPWAKGPPKFPLATGSSVAAKRWWARVWSLPPAKLWTDADVLLAEQCCELVERQARAVKPNTALAGEIRLRQASLGIGKAPVGGQALAVGVVQAKASPVHPPANRPRRADGSPIPDSGSASHWADGVPKKTHVMRSV